MAWTCVIPWQNTYHGTKGTKTAATTILDNHIKTEALVAVVSLRFKAEVNTLCFMEECHHSGKPSAKRQDGARRIALSLLSNFQQYFSHLLAFFWVLFATHLACINLLRKRCPSLPGSLEPWRSFKKILVRVHKCAHSVLCYNRNIQHIQGSLLVLIRACTFEDCP